VDTGDAQPGAGGEPPGDDTGAAGHVEQVPGGVREEGEHRVGGGAGPGLTPAGGVVAFGFLVVVEHAPQCAPRAGARSRTRRARSRSWAGAAPRWLWVCTDRATVL